ncbi:MAG: YqgE/AlgH family protein [Alphaproteobacteria bacterium]
MARDEFDEGTGYFEGHMLVAMPQMSDPRFERSVIYLCAHSSEGAMGLVVNKLVDTITFPDLLQQLNIEVEGDTEPIRVHFGGPVESGRGFVLHSDDYVQESTLVINEGIALTATVDVLRAIAHGEGPRRSLLALGYAGWAPGQLDAEVQANGWLQVPPDEDLIFGANLDNKWERAINKIGIDLSLLSPTAGRA